MSTLAETHDALLLDLDGTVYLGGQPIDHVGPALARAGQQGARSVFVTNNASRPPAEVAESLTAMGVPASPHDVLTSPEAAADMLIERHPAGSKVLVVGAPWLVESVSQVGLTPVRLATDDQTDADTFSAPEELPTAESDDQGLPHAPDARVTDTDTGGTTGASTATADPTAGTGDVSPPADPLFVPPLFSDDPLAGDR